VQLRTRGETLVATIKGHAHEYVDAVRVAPLTHPDRYIAIVDLNGKEITMLEDLSVLDNESKDALNEALRRRYMTAVVLKIRSMKDELGVTYFDVDTDRGRREFVVQNLLEGARWLGERRLLIFDVDGNRFEIPDIDALDKRSIRLLSAIV